MMRKFWVLLLCISLPLMAQENISPYLCRNMGVWVEDGSVVSGKIVAWNSSDSRWCMEHNGLFYYPGCVQYIGHFRGVRQWYVHYGNECVRKHLVCHAEYQTYAHTVDFIFDDQLDWWLNECPDVVLPPIVEPPYEAVDPLN